MLLKQRQIWEPSLGLSAQAQQIMEMSCPSPQKALSYESAWRWFLSCVFFFYLKLQREKVKRFLLLYYFSLTSSLLVVILLF